MDTALVNPDADELGYSTFSEDMATFIQEKVPDDTFVIAIYGDWGSGKSSILNFIEYYLNEHEEPPFVIRFNPWWFTGQEDLIGKYFEELESALAKDNRFDELRGKINRFASLVTHVPSSATGGIPINRAGKIVSKLTNSSQPTLNELKNDISELLEESDRRIVVLIDDIDRLTSEEIRQMFRLVKSVADFPNTTYVMAFDQDVVIDALDGEQRHGNGEEYLNKIIQLPQHVPIPEEGARRALLGERLTLLMQNTEVHLDESRFQRVYEDGIFPVIDTPRDIIRLTNAVDTLNSRIGEEVDFVDLVSIETLRVFYRPVFEEIRDNPDNFVIKPGHNDVADDQFSFLNDIYDELNNGNEEQIKTIVGYLFPQYGTSASRFHVGDFGEYRRRKRICHPDVFPFYFRQTIPRGEIPTSEMESMLKLTSDPETFSERLLEYTEQDGKRGRSQATTFVRRFEDHLSEVSAERIADVLTAFFLVGDELISIDPSEGILDDGIDGPLLRVIWNLIEGIEFGHRHEPLITAIEQGKSIYLPFYFIGVMMQEHGEYGGEKREEEDQTLSWEQIESLQKASVEKAEDLAGSDELLNAPKLHFVLTRWHEWGDETEVEEWAETVFNNDSNLIILLKKMVQVGRHSSGTRVTRIEYIDPTNVEPFLDISDVKTQLEDLDTQELEEPEREAVEMFFEGLERMDRGSDPGNFGEWSMAEIRNRSNGDAQ